MDRTEMEEKIKLWYEIRASRNKIPSWFAKNHIIDLPVLDNEILLYYYEHSSNYKLNHTTLEDGLCYNNGEPCIHRYEYYGCAGCHIKMECDKMRPQEES